MVTGSVGLSSVTGTIKEGTENCIAEAKNNAGTALRRAGALHAMPSSDEESVVVTLICDYGGRR